MDVAEVLEVSRARSLARSGRARELRVGADLTQDEVAEALGVRRNTVSRWEMGRQLPRGPLAVRYGALLRQLARRRRR